MPSSSRLLASASTDDFDWTGLESVTLGIRKYLERPSRRIAAVYFPEGIRIRCCCSSIQRQTGRGWIDQPPGHGKATQTCVSLRDSLLKFAQVFGVQTTHTAICSAQSRLDVRLARWLLMADDHLHER
jgi:hypothetical protein